MNLNNLLEIPSHFQTSKKPLVTSKIVMNHLCLALYLQLLLTKRVELIILLDTPISLVHYSSLVLLCLVHRYIPILWTESETTLRPRDA